MPLFIQWQITINTRLQNMLMDSTLHSEPSKLEYSSHHENTLTVVNLEGVSSWKSRFSGLQASSFPVRRPALCTHGAYSCHSSSARDGVLQHHKIARCHSTTPRHGPPGDHKRQIDSSSGMSVFRCFPAVPAVGSKDRNGSFCSVVLFTSMSGTGYF